MIRMIIAGSRGFDNYELLERECHRALAKLAGMNIISGEIDKDIGCIEIISGTANGADKLGERFADEYGIAVKRFPADWNVCGKRAGYVRNAQMADYASAKGNVGVLIAFWDGKSKGTKMMVDIAKRKKIITTVVECREGTFDVRF